jgi:hypothetical protein
VGKHGSPPAWGEVGGSHSAPGAAAGGFFPNAPGALRRGPSGPGEETHPREQRGFTLPGAPVGNSDDARRDRDSWRNNAGPPPGMAAYGAAPGRGPPGAMGMGPGAPGAPYGSDAGMAPVVRGGPGKPGQPRQGFSLGRGRGARGPVYPTAAGAAGSDAGSDMGVAYVDAPPPPPYGPIKYRYDAHALLRMRDALAAQLGALPMPVGVATDAVPRNDMAASDPMAEFVYAGAGLGMMGGGGAPRALPASAAGGPARPADAPSWGRAAAVPAPHDEDAGLPEWAREDAAAPGRAQAHTADVRAAAGSGWSAAAEAKMAERLAEARYDPSGGASSAGGAPAGGRSRLLAALDVPDAEEEEALRGPAEDAWSYKDPEGTVQGPFTSGDILDWLAGGYFPANLPVRPARGPASRGEFLPLAELAPRWQKGDMAWPLGGGGVSQAQAQAQAKLQQQQAAAQAQAQAQAQAHAAQQAAAQAAAQKQQQQQQQQQAQQQHMLMQQLHAAQQAHSAAQAQAAAAAAGSPQRGPTLPPWLMSAAASASNLPPMPSMEQLAGMRTLQQVEAAAAMAAGNGGAPRMRSMEEIEAAQLASHYGRGAAQGMGPGGMGMGMGAPGGGAGLPQAFWDAAARQQAAAQQQQQQQQQQQHAAHAQAHAMGGGPQQGAPGGPVGRALVPFFEGAAPSGQDAPGGWGAPGGAPRQAPVGDSPWDMPGAAGAPAQATAVQQQQALAMQHHMHQQALAAQQQQQRQQQLPGMAAAMQRDELERLDLERAHAAYQQHAVAQAAQKQKAQHAAQQQQPAAPPRNPWGGTAAAPGAPGAPKSLLDIQREEAARAAAAAADKARAGNPAPLGPWGAGPPMRTGSGRNLVEIQEEELRRAHAAQQQQHAQQPAFSDAPATPDKPGLPVSAAWGAGGTPPGAAVAGGGGGGSKSIRTIQEEQMRALREQQLRKAQASVSASNGGVLPPAAGMGVDEAMFWEYGRGGADVQPAAQPAAPQGGAKGGWAAAAAHAPPQDAYSRAQAAAAAAQAARKPSAPAAAPGGARPGALAAAPPKASGPGSPAAAAPPGGGKKGAKARQAEFRSWCEAQMQSLTGSNDLTLVDFLSSLPSAGEVRDYVALYLGEGERPTAFAVEFLRRKRADPALSAAGGEFGAAAD